MENLEFSSRVEITNLGLAKPSWNFKSVYRDGTFTCNCNVILTLLTGKSCVLPRFYSIQYKEWLLGCFWSFSYVYTISQVLYIPLSRIKSTDGWKMWFIKYTVKTDGCSFQQVLRQRLGWFFVLTLGNALS